MDFDTKGGVILLDKKKIGKAIAYLRKRAGYTQKDLADRIGISDKAVSKWERGLGMPDIAYLGKLAILLDTDTEGLLAGDVIHHNKAWRGLLVLENNGEGVSAETMIYDKPLVYFQLGYFLLLGIRNIFVVCNQREQDFLNMEFGIKKELGMEFFFCGQNTRDVLEKLLDPDMEYNNLMIVYGRDLIYGVDQTRFFQRAMVRKDHATILSLPKKIWDKPCERDEPWDESSYLLAQETLSFDESRKLVSFDSEEKIYTQYDYYKLPIMFCPKKKVSVFVHSALNETFHLDIVNEIDEPLYTEVLDRGFVDLKIDTIDQALEAAQFVKLVQKSCGMEIYCLEEIAWRRGIISLEKIKEFGMRKKDTVYGRYLLNLANSHRGTERRGDC